jgi:hypothetical protein
MMANLVIVGCGETAYLAYEYFFKDGKYKMYYGYGGEEYPYQ